MALLWKGTHSHKQIHIRSGGEIDVKTGASLKLAGTALTPTAAELNYVAGVTSAIQTQMDLKAPKASPTFTGAVVVPTPFTVGAVSVTATGTELNLIDGSVAGTAVVSKAAVLGANKELDEFHTAALYLGAGAGTLVGPTAANFNTQIRVASVEISSAEILALYTTPKELVAAPGAGNVLELVSLLLAYDWGTAAYTIGTAGNLQVKYTDGSGAAASTTRAATGFLDAVADTLSLMDKLEASTVAVTNAALVLTLATANPTAGDSPIHAKVAYRVHATGL